MEKISIDLYDLMEIVSEFIYDQQESNPMEMTSFCEYSFKKHLDCNKNLDHSCY